MVAATPLPSQQQQQQQQQRPQAPAKTSAEEEALKRNTDCVYFLASPLTCKKGSECDYRHSEYARVNPRDCYFWLNGNCLNPKCGFRHPPLDGLLGNQVATPGGSSAPSSHATVTPAVHATFNSSKQAVSCIFFQKGFCLKGDKCAFSHGPPPPPTNSVSSQPTNTSTVPHSLKKANFGGLENSYQQQQVNPANVSKMVGPPELKSAPKVEITSHRSGVGTERNAPPCLGDEEVPRHRANVSTTVNGITVGRSNRVGQAHASDEQNLHTGKDTDEYLRESSPGFDVLVDDELRDSDYYDDEDQYGRTRGRESRNMNEYDIGHSANYDAGADVDRESLRSSRGYDSFDTMQGQYGLEPHMMSERMAAVPAYIERRGYSKSPDRIGESDLRHALSKHRKVNGLRSVVSHDHALENHAEERSYRGSSRRDSHHFPQHESSLSSRLRGRIRIPGRSSGSATDLHPEREVGRNWGRLSPGRQSSLQQGRLRDRIRGRVEGEHEIKEGRAVRGPGIRREITDDRYTEFEGPKSLAELKNGKKVENKEHQFLGKRKNIDNSQQFEGDLSFEGPMPLSEILKRKRQAEAGASGSGASSVNRDDNNQKRGKESSISSSTKTTVSTTQGAHSSVSKEETDGKDESKSTMVYAAETAEGKSGVVHDGEFSQQLNVSENEIEDGMVTDERIEDHELEPDDQRDGEYYYEQGDEGEYNYEEGENAGGEEEYLDDEEGDGDGDDFAKKIGVMFS